MEKFIDQLTDILKFYSDGVFYSGKVTVKKKLKVKIDKTKKYDFTQSDQFFIENYKVEKLGKFENMLKYATVGFVTEEITKQIQEEWNIETADNGKFTYQKQEMVDDELDEILEIVLDTITSIYDEVLETAVKEVISLFKRGQIEEYRNLNINKLTIRSSSDEGCCNVCKVRANNVLDINDCTEEFDVNKDIIHPFCKVSIEPVINYDSLIGKTQDKFSLSEDTIVEGFDSLHINKEIDHTVEELKLGNFTFINVPVEIEERINKFYSKNRFYLREFIKPLEFHFVKDIVNTKEWFNDYKNQYIEEGDFASSNKTYIAQDSLKNSISTYRSSNKIFISNFALLTNNIENIIVREMFRNIEFPQFDWWKEKYEEGVQEDKIGEGLSLTKSVFVNHLSRLSVESFILESIVFYVNNPTVLRGIDEEVYYEIKSFFNGVQF